MLTTRMIRALGILLCAVTTNTVRTTKDTANAVKIIWVNTELASTGASRHRTGSRNLPIGNQPALNAKSQIIISPNHGVKTV